MKNQDLIAYLKPIANKFSKPDAVEFIDVTGQVSDIQSDRATLTIRLVLPAGWYRGNFATREHAFDMSTAMMEMIRVPDGKRVAVGPWDLDHIRNVMAMPMIRTYVNGKLLGGLWFDMPGPERIANGSLFADFGFEAKEGENEIQLEIIARDRERIDWGRIEYIEMHRDDRRPVVLEPKLQGHPRIFTDAPSARRVAARWAKRPEFQRLREQLKTEELAFLTDNSQGPLELACLMFTLTGDAQIGQRAKARIMEMARAPTWSGRPDPLLMGGDNDRVIGNALYYTALGWDYLQPILSSADRPPILAKVEEYLVKMYDFTLLQRAYMGYQTVEPHSLGTWNGVAIACMAFYDELPIARRALPLFHGLFCDSLKLFPASGKAAWATYFPFHLVRYLAAAEIFGGKREELSSSPFLDNLGSALMAAFDVPNSQELQRGLRTREHRYITAFLCRFHPTSGIEGIYQAFVERERKAAGDVVLGMFDLLYAPEPGVPPAPYPNRPLYARDVGDVIVTARGENLVAVSLSGGAKAGRRAIFSLMPHNREFPPSLGAIEVTIDGTPVLCNINIGTYGLNSALTNAMCFEDGGVITNGQYLNGEVPPDDCAVIRRCFINDRFLYVHVVVTYSLHPDLQIEHADRIFIFDRRHGITLLSDSFQGARPIRFATHLHCSGSISDLGDGSYRMTGGQEKLIAGIKYGNDGMKDEEKGEIFVSILRSSGSAKVVQEEPTWVPGYIYGLNGTGKENISEGHFPRYRRWRLEQEGRVTDGSFLLALSPHHDQVQWKNGEILLTSGGGVLLGPGWLQALDVQADCECLLWNPDPAQVAALGAKTLKHAGKTITFANPVDVEYDLKRGTGTVFAQGKYATPAKRGFTTSAWELAGDEAWRTHSPYRSKLATTSDG
jgi:hypothetical protein